MIFITNFTAETEAVGESLGKLLRPGQVVALYGELGAGKTAFVRGMARGMGITSGVKSPTFAIVNEYPGEISLFHFDMYRLGSSAELFDIGWEDYLGRGGVCVAEWSENVEDIFGPDVIAVRLRKLPGDLNRREIEISPQLPLPQTNGENHEDTSP